jgi:hypothetical protein
MTKPLTQLEAFFCSSFEVPRDRLLLFIKYRLLTNYLETNFRANRERIGIL